MPSSCALRSEVNSSSSRTSPIRPERKAWTTVGSTIDRATSWFSACMDMVFPPVACLLVNTGELRSVIVSWFSFFGRELRQSKPIVSLPDLAAKYFGLPTNYAVL